MRRPIGFFITIIVAVFVLNACAGRPNSAIARQCSNSLDQAYREMDRAKAAGFSSSVALTKAGTLLGAAQAQQGIERYAGCVSKVRKARAYIRAARK